MPLTRRLTPLTSAYVCHMLPGMKKTLLAPICSAFVIPGLGQIVNGHLKKGALILAALFFLFVIGAIKLYIMVSAAMDKAETALPGAGAFAESLKSEDPTALGVFGAAFLALWLYAVVDAAVWGARLEASEKGGPA